jgi:hypothetical protein
MKKITETQLQILERLNDYRFLTVQQMQRIGIAKNTQTIHKAIKALHDTGKRLADYVDFGTFPTIGRLPRIHYLTKHGARLLAEALRIDPSEIHYPKGVKVFSRDYFHRVDTIDLHILARSFCEAHEGVELDFFQTYFEHTGANHWGDPAKPKREALNKIIIDEKTALIPDCVFRISDPNGKPFLFVGEIYRGHSTKRLQQQLHKYLLSIQTGAINNAYNYLSGFPVLIVCETEKALISLIKRIERDRVFQYAEDYFLFKTFDQVGQGVTRAELQNAFATGWKTYTSKERGLFR